MATFRFDMNKYLSDYVEQMTKPNSPYSTSADFFRCLVREHIRANINDIAYKQSFEELTPVQRAQAGNAALQGVKSYERWREKMLLARPDLLHALDAIDIELREVSRENGVTG